ncbi:CRISPR-associated endonuclease Cas1 [Methylomarinum sp. Ch1-1]|uniref:CRISPR-associated endonuclease Cas1 n=1 Tax=Methylomarinum roseum TaxID=3067653 RepID=A0AAU7NQ24_9GAMM|nr:CRISPR-associated endonuclease Cas1 [Methylomarinum sp. Ch1-1]MDP4521005.1 CRISPR-associated endonuclease Cas1 [Methylomarinum sp. Ch1-1]
MKPLYVQGKAGIKVEFDDPALAVSVPDKSRQLFPLARVSRVIVSGSVDWSMAALFACADAGISVIFLTDGGKVRSRWLGSLRNRQSFMQNLQEMLQKTDAEVFYRNWYAGMQRMAVRSTARRLGFSDWQLADADCFNGWLDDYLDAEWSAVVGRFNGMLVSAVLQYLGDLGLDSGDDSVAGERFFLADDLAALLLWDFYPPLVCLRKQSGVCPDHAGLVVLFERRKQRIEHLLRGLLNKLHQCLRENR